jgi:hypothetical protein
MESKLTTVVNVKHAKCDVYMGRPHPKIDPLMEGGDGYYGNPYHVEPHGRELAISMFKVQFERRIKKDAVYRLRLLACRGKVCGCHCKPLPCHVDVIADWINSQPIEDEKETAAS